MSPQTQGQSAAEGYGPGLDYPSGGYPIAGEPATRDSSSQPLRTAAEVAAGGLSVGGLGDRTRGVGHAADDAIDGSDEQGEASTNADELSGTTNTDYSSQGDDSMLSDNIGDE